MYWHLPVTTRDRLYDLFYCRDVRSECVAMKSEMASIAYFYLVIIICMCTDSIWLLVLYFVSTTNDESWQSTN